MASKRKIKLPNKLIPIPNADKEFHEVWSPGRNMLNIPHPYRAVVMGPPNKGKSTTVKNILLRADPPFEEIFVVHCDSEGTAEYADIGAEMLSEIPAPEEWAGVVKSLVILDDLELKMMKKEQLRNLDRLFGYVSTHKNISIILCCQDPFNCPPIVRRCANLWVLYQGTDLDSFNQLARKAGYPKSKFSQIFSVCDEFHDSIWIDRTSGSPYPLRKNGFEIIDKP